MFRHILIPTDGSTTAGKAVRAGIALARETGAKVTGYYAMESMQPQYYGEGFIVDRRILAELERRARGAGEKHLERIRKAAQSAGIPYTSLMTKAYAPHEGIIAAAKKQKCDVIFMATHGRGGIASLLLGSVTQKVLSHSSIPVLVYR